MMGDDGEKFGAWPGTFEYCWSREHWVDRMFEAIERESAWLATVTPSEWLERQPPTTRVYVPTASYVEMTEWVLPPDETRVFTELLETAREEGSPGGPIPARRLLAQLRRPLPRDQRSPQADAAGVGQGRRDGRRARPSARALDHLYQGQSNDCYWHGLFGGVYIVHMRLATLARLIAAEDLADQAQAAGGGRRPTAPGWPTRTWTP